MAHDWKPLGKLADSALWQCRTCHTIVQVPHGLPPSPDKLVSNRYPDPSPGKLNKDRTGSDFREITCEEVIANEVMNS